MNLGLFKNATNPLARQETQGAKILAEIYMGQIKAIKIAEIGGQTKIAKTSNATGIFSVPPLMYSLPSYPRGMTFGFIMIS